MTPSNVYFTTFRTSFRENLLQKLERLIKKAGLFEQVDFQNKYPLKSISASRETWPTCAPTIQRCWQI